MAPVVLAAGDLPNLADLDALTSMLIGSFYGRLCSCNWLRAPGARSLAIGAIRHGVGRQAA
ncbi:MAG TPA: hypothetical protein VIX82_00650 [Solirubrobacteraceae bacterium]